MKQFIVLGGLASFLVACSSSNQSQSEQALSRYTHFVDSIYSQNEIWKSKADTDFVEMAINPSEPSVIRLDTVITPPESKTTLLQDNFMSKPILTAYEPLQKEMELLAPTMEQSMKDQYHQARQKFESLRTAEGSK
jgi:hypothetical protein